MHPPRVQLACGTMWLDETANHSASQSARTASQSKGAKLACLVEQKLSHTRTPSLIHPLRFLIKNRIVNLGFVDK